KVLEEDPLPPSRFNVQAPGAMDAIVRKALAKRPDDRYQNAEAFSDALRDAAQREPTPAPRPAAAPAPQRGSMSSSSDPTGIASTDPTVIRAPDAKGAEQASSATTASATAARTNAVPTSPPPKKSQATMITLIVTVAVVVIVITSRPWTYLKPSADTGK